MADPILDPVTPAPVTTEPTATTDPPTVVTPDPVVVTPPVTAPTLDADKLGAAVAKGITDAMRTAQAGSGVPDRPLAKYTTDQLLAAKFEVNADGTPLAPAQLLTIERELEAKRREELYMTTQFTSEKVAGRTKIEREYPEFSDPSGPLYLKAVEIMEGGDPSALAPKALGILVEAAAHRVGIQPVSKRGLAPNPAAVARQETLEQIQAASAAAALPRGSGGSASPAPIKSPLDMTYQELEAETVRRRGY